MTNNRQNQSLNLHSSTITTTSALQRRSSVFPIIEFIGKNQTLSAGASTVILWNQILRQTDQPITSWIPGNQNNTTSNFVWPVFVNPSLGLVDYRIKFNVSGYYHISLSTVLVSASIATLTLVLIDGSYTSAPIMQTSTQTFPSQTQQVFTIMLYIEAGWSLECYITSTLANTLVTSGLYQTVGPSPRLTIAQIAQFEDVNVGKMSRATSNTTIATTTATPTVVTSLSVPPAAPEDPILGYVYNAGGGNQLNIFDGRTNNRLIISQSGIYLIHGQITLRNENTSVGTRLIVLAANNATVLASQSLAANANAGRWLNISVIFPLNAGDYLQVYGLQNSGGNIDMVTFGISHSISATLLTAT